MIGVANDNLALQLGNKKRHGFFVVELCAKAVGRILFFLLLFEFYQKRAHRPGA